MEFLILIGGVAFVPLIHYYATPVEPRVSGFVKADSPPVLVKSSSLDKIHEFKPRLTDMKEKFTPFSKKPSKKKEFFIFISLILFSLFLAVFLNSHSFSQLYSWVINLNYVSK